jgi:uroporphyrinogen III methyltransferase/synthase
LLSLAGQGKTVVRLWPGDPFIFGRAAQEMTAAKEAGLRVEIVPGVTSAIAAPAYAGVPVTHWDFANSFTVVAGYEPEASARRVNWSALAGGDTLVIMMPLERLPEITAVLLAAGRPASTPALIIQHGTLPGQKQLQTTLDRVAETAVAEAFDHPTIVVVGEVVRLASELAWFKVGHDLPLLGKRVLVTRPVHQATDLIVALRALGAEPISFPTIEICPVEDTRPLDDAIRRVSEAANRRIRGQGSGVGDKQPGINDKRDRTDYDWLVVTSANGVAAFWERLEALGLDSRCLAALRIAAIGPATATALKERSITPDLVPEVYTAEGVLAAFDRHGPVAGQRFLLARADIARKTLAEGLVERGAVVDEIASYRTVPVKKVTRPPAADIVTFTSSSTVQGYVNCLGGRRPAEALQSSQVVCIGPITAATARELGVPVSAVAEEFTIAGLLEVLKTLSS